MRRIVLATICSVLVAMISLGTAGGATAQSGTLSGHWTSIDTDGSSQTLDIMGAGIGPYAMFLFDDSATNACGGAPARFVGTGATDGDTLVMVGTLSCLPGGNVVRHRIAFGFTYSAATGTLTDESGVVWTRA